MSDVTPSFPMLLQRFFVDHLRQQRAVSPSTVAAYRDTFKMLLAFSQKAIGKAPTDLALTDLDATLILAFLDHLERERKNCVRSRNARLSAIRSFLKFAAHEDLTALAVIERSLAVPQKRHDKAVLGFLSRPEMDAIIAAPDCATWAGRRDQALFTLLYNTGARVSEAINLRVDDVVLDVSPVAHLHGKGRKRRSVPLWKATAATLRQWLRHLPDTGSQGYLFPSSAGRRLSRSSVTQRLAQAVAEVVCQLPALAERAVSPHTIRHTTAMHLLQSGVDITVIALWLGHEHPSTTHIYMEADLAMKEAALSRLQPIATVPARYCPPDELMAFLQSL
ncbi:tyrosine-type recombinase/integrase [Bradyrhizobium sp. Ai1a-2]|uniref:tyrosine-type recombinase/integrase n=1 Tax=Bradyrhizobium sp. Ai1a-2 TaxID=196490 RepID=UPI000483FE3A|nr:tyrosine-type recombinase/integrase [Bradyrhizobium sp. Ai1a-2]